MPFYRTHAQRQGYWSSSLWTISLHPMKNGAFLVFFVVALSACGPWPQVDAPTRDDEGTWPVLLPLDDVTSPSRSTGAAQSEAQRLSARAAGLRSRARLMRASVPDLDAMDALRARLAR